MLEVTVLNIFLRFWDVFYVLYYRPIHSNESAGLEWHFLEHYELTTTLSNYYYSVHADSEMVEFHLLRCVCEAVMALKAKYRRPWLATEGGSRRRDGRYVTPVLLTG